MNILIPDVWLKDFLKTKATPQQIKDYLSLCGPSVERIQGSGKDVVYDIEVTGNRPDAMSVFGIAREAFAILPRFKIAAKLVGDPYKTKKPTYSGKKALTIKTNPTLNPRWTSVVLSNVRVAPSPTWLQKLLEGTGIRSVNNVVDVTNYLMRAYGQPAHAFDYDEIKDHTMVLRESKKGEKIVTLDGVSHILPGNDIVIEDGSGRIIDLCGIMGGYNSSIKNGTTSVVLFLQTYNPKNIRNTTMKLATRTEAATLFEKGLDEELVLPALIKGVDLLSQLTGGHVDSKLYDFYPKPFKQYKVSCSSEKLTSYIGAKLTESEIKKMIEPLGFEVKKDLRVQIPSWRRDVRIDVDIIEEVARIYGYHNITPTLPTTAPPLVLPNQQLYWEKELKTRLRDWGYTEVLTYSMISEKLMTVFSLDTKKAYKIANPLSEEWLYMQPAPWPSVLSIVEQNLHHEDSLQLFNVSMEYVWQKNDLPYEKPILMVIWTGHKFREAKGLSESIFSLMGIKDFTDNSKPKKMNWYGNSVQLGNYGSVGEVKPELLRLLGINKPITILDLELDELVSHAHPDKTYVPIPKYPPIIEDFSFIVPPGFQVGPLLDVLSHVHKLITSVTLLDAFENKRTVRVMYSDPKRTLTNLDIAPVHQKILEYAAEKFGVSPVI